MTKLSINWVYMECTSIYKRTYVTSPQVTPLVQFSRSIMSDSLWHHGLQYARLPCLSPTPRTCSNSCYQDSDAFQSSHPLLSPSPSAFTLSQHQGVFQWVTSSHQVAKVLELQLQHQSFQWIFRTDFLWNSFRVSNSMKRLKVKTL